MANKPFIGIKFPGLEDTYIAPQVDDTLAVTGAAADAKTVGDALDAVNGTLATKADADGTYTDMAVGDVVSDKKITDTTPYLFRPSASVGERAYETLVGASVGWNQLVQSARASTQVYGLTITRSEDGTSDTITGTATNTGNVTLTGASVTAVANHVYIGSFGTASVSGCVLNFSTIGAVGTIAQLVKPTASRDLGITAYITSGATINITVKPQIIDLTALLGTTIADYVYSLESSTAGSGIAKLREWGFCTGYVPYNAGSIESVEVTEKKVAGFNQWNEEWEVGSYNSSTGEAVALTDRIRGKNYIPVIPSATYYFAMPSSTSGNVFFYDANKAFLSSQFLYAGTFSVPSNAYYLHIAMQPTYGTTYNHDICISLSSSRNGEYEPYKSASYSLGNDTLRGIFKLDANNNLYADGDVKTSDGVITRKYGIVDLGTLNWASEDAVLAGLFRAPRQNPDVALMKWQGYLVSSKYILQRIASYSDLADKCISVTNSQESQILRIRDSSFSGQTAEAFKASLSGLYLVYELQTPTTETSTPFTSPQTVYPDGTEQFITENGVPVGHSTDYPYSIKALAEELIGIPNVPSANGTYVLKATRSASGITYAWEVTT